MLNSPVGEVKQEHRVKDNIFWVVSINVINNNNNSNNNNSSNNNNNSSNNNSNNKKNSSNVTEIMEVQMLASLIEKH